MKQMSNNPKQASKTALVYCRVSTSKQEDKGTSLDSQTEACTKHAESLGYTVGRVTKETFSGADLFERPLLARDRADIRTGQFQAIVCYAIDRLSRDIAHLAIVADECKRANVELIFVTENLDDSPQGKLLRSVQGYVAEVERLKIRERTVRGKYTRVRQGKIHSAGSELYGFTRDKELGVRLVNDPEAAVVREIYQWVNGGLGIRGVIRKLNELGIPSPASGKRVFRDGRKTTRWGKGAVRRILREPAYQGETIVWRWKSAGKGTKVIQRPPAEHIRMPDGITPAIVSPEAWQAVQVRLDKNTGAEARNQKRPYLLRGRVYCLACGRRMRANIEKGLRVYRCSSRETPEGKCVGKRAPAQEAETTVWQHVSEILTRPAIIKNEIRRQQSQGPDLGLGEELERAQQKLGAIDAGLDRLLTKFRQTENASLWDLLEIQVKQAEKEKGLINARIAEIHSKLAVQQSTRLALEKLDSYCGRVASRISSLDFSQKRLALDALGVKVFASGHETRLDITLPVACIENTTSCSLVRPGRARPCSRSGFPRFFLP